MQHRLGNEGDHPLRCGQEIVQVDHEGSGRCRGRLRRKAAPELLRPARRRRAQPFHQLANLLVLEQAPHQLGAWVLPLVVAEAAWQEHLCLDPQQPRRHLQVIRRLIQSEVVDDSEKLIRDLGDGQVGDIDLVLMDQVQQEIERSRELLELDDKTALLLGRRRDAGHRMACVPGSA